MLKNKHTELTETYFVTTNTIKNTINPKNNTKNDGIIAKNTPIAVATPFPPLKFKKIENI
jgi:hypothetical protein